MSMFERTLPSNSSHIVLRKNRASGLNADMAESTMPEFRSELDTVKDR